MVEESLPIDFMLCKPPSPLQPGGRGLKGARHTSILPCRAAPKDDISGGWRLEEIISSRLPFLPDFIGLDPINESDAKSLPIVIAF
jgi:hypothetical protein